MKSFEADFNLRPQTEKPEQFAVVARGAGVFAMQILVPPLGVLAESPYERDVTNLNSRSTESLDFLEELEVQTPPNHLLLMNQERLTPRDNAGIRSTLGAQALHPTLAAA